MTSWEKEMCAAVQATNLKLVKSILARDDVQESGDLGREQWNYGENPLQWAAYFWNEENAEESIFRILTDSGIDVNSYGLYKEGKETYTALHWAAMANSVSKVRCLLGLGADVALQGNYIGMSGTPLDWAVKRGYDEVARVLKEGQEGARAFAAAAVPPAPETTDLLASFEAMDTMEKLMQKNKLVEELEEAYQLQTEFETKTAQIEDLHDKMKLAEEERRRDEDQLEVLTKEVKTLEAQPVFKCVELLKKRLEEIEEIRVTLKEVIREEKDSCPLCFLFPQKVFACQECEGWACQDCRERVGMCPSCEEDLEEKPLMRSRLAEKMMGIN